MLLVRDNPAVARRGIVWISPADPVPAGRMVDPSESRFSVSWQDDEPLEHIEITGAEPAIGCSQRPRPSAACSWLVDFGRVWIVSLVRTPRRYAAGVHAARAEEAARRALAPGG
jgi:hypothetical protein